MKPSDVVRAHIKGGDYNRDRDTLLERIAQELDALAAGPSRQAERTLLFTDLQSIKDAVCGGINACDRDLSYSESVMADMNYALEIVNKALLQPEPITATVAPAVDEKLRDKIRAAIANDDISNYTGDYLIRREDRENTRLTERAIDRLADIAAQVVAAQPSGEVTVFTEMATVADKLNKLKYWGLDGWQFTGYKFDCGGSQCSIETACTAANEQPPHATVDGVARVKAAWTAFHESPLTPTTWDQCYANLKHAIEALGSSDDGADTARLDWLESHHRDIFYLASWGFFVYDKGNRREIAHPTAREAIDAAIQQEARTGGSDE